MIEASCHCGAFRLEIASAPTDVYECNCSICRRLGTLWAYYHPDQVTRVTDHGATFAYCWGDRSLEFHNCRTCGCTTHWQALDPDASRMGVNARLMEGLDPATVRIRHIRNAETDAFWTTATAIAAPTMTEAVRRLEQGDWEEAHAIVQEDPSALACWAHGIVHLMEGDRANAEYWYRRAERELAATPDVPSEIAALRRSVERRG